MSSIALLPEPCRSCVAWELPADAVAESHRSGLSAFEKEVWLSGVMLTWGSAGTLVTVDDRPAAFALFAPPPAVPGVAAFPSGPVSPDAVLLTAARVLGEFRGQGLGRYLFAGVFSELIRRRVRAVELFARTRPVKGRERTRGGTEPEPKTLPDGPKACTVPQGFAEAVGFVTVAPHHRYPRMRMELSGESGWKADVEAALDRLLESIQVPLAPAREPALAGAAGGPALCNPVLPGPLTGRVDLGTAGEGQVVGKGQRCEADARPPAEQ